MSSQRIIVDGESLLHLLTAYYDGEVPMDAKLLQVGISKFLGRWIGLLVESGQWPSGNSVENGDGDYPLILRYEGRRTMSWTKRDEQPITWGREGTDFEIPK